MFNAIGANSRKAKILAEALSQERKSLQAKGLLPDWYTTAAWKMLKTKYLPRGEKGLKDRHTKISKTLARHLPAPYVQEYEERFFNEMWDGILSPSSPALANTGTKHGMPVACSGQKIGNSVWSFYTGLRETAMLSKNAFGTSADFSDIQARGVTFAESGEANGVKEVIEDFFTSAAKIAQGGNRRGSFAAYLDIEHPDFYECLDSLRTHSNGKNYGWTIRDTFINRLLANDPEAHKRWTDALHVKLLTGKGYLFFPDKANRHRPEMYKRLGLDIIATNLCTEIMLHSSELLTYSCILASINLKHWDVIKERKSVFTATVFLDCLCSEFIEISKGKRGLDKVRTFTEKGRAIGLGVLGFATYLQEKRIPYESLEAYFLNKQIFKHLHDESLEASKWLAEVLGEPEWCKGTGLRNTHRTAVAPTKSTSNLMGGVEESVFPSPAMVYEASSSVGGLPRINAVLYELMKERGVYNQETLDDIVAHAGSVQHVDWLDDHEKAVFRTAFEMDQEVIYRYAKERQKHLCQGQSLNFYFADQGSEQKIASLMTRVTLDPDILSQYYIYSKSGVIVNDECLACAA
ncbi:ribonucleotide reductase N-terminal alpha domain-containing protein [Acinetobacter sp. A47]|uniref:ribonucleotide reductase N-terminal alpha domain-containing protein n=1 Tax=Acinetobacter sp. A47 TaxID=1561217 RepID=UPI00056DAC2B|nr:ribonucleotide reductase N-terminal alpha domain-containing protein [Acinetobacter sp. A47]